jgi:hypothetical protein
MMAITPEIAELSKPPEKVRKAGGVLAFRLCVLQELRGLGD